MNSDKLRRYKELRTQVVDFITEADASLAENAKTRGNPKGTELEEFRSKVENDRFEMVLIGAFQSGKSTFFNYLCDGRELSPIGFGIRTSGCKVSAHYVESDRAEKAVLTWRSPAELLKSLGGALVPYFANGEKTPSHTYLTEAEVNLSNAGDRKKLADAAWDRLSSSADEDSLELVRLALMVTRFYPEYEQRCMQGTTEMSFEEATKMASYPSTWSKLWLEAMQGRDLSCFKPQDVAFAFVSAMDVYVNSPMLKELGSSVTDSPGLFISEWDTEIARKCMHQADAVLFTFSGEKAMTAEEKKVLLQCIKTGVQDKLILGANLKVPENQWKRILEDSVAPDLAKAGFESPVVHPYHAALALRAREYMALSYGAMSPETAQAIDDMVSLKEGQPVSSEDARMNFLKKRIGRYVATLSDDDEDWQTYASMEEPKRYDELEKRSGAPAFIEAANAIMAPRKSRSVLIEQGIKPALQALSNAAAQSRHLTEQLSRNVEEAEENLKNQQEEIDVFERSRQASINAIDNQIQLSKEGIVAYSRQCAAEILDESRNDIVTVIERHLPKCGLGKVIFGPVIDLARYLWGEEKQAVVEGQRFSADFAPVLDGILVKLRERVANNLSKTTDFNKLIRVFEDERERLKHQIRGLKDIGRLAEIDIKIDLDPTQAVKEMMLGTASEMFTDAAAAATYDVWSWLWDLLTCCVFAPFRSQRQHAEGVFNKKHDDLCGMLGNAIERALRSPKGPFFKIDAFRNKFDATFQQPAQSYEKTKKELQDTLLKASNKAEIIQVLTRQVESGEQIKAKGRKLLETCEAFCAEPA